MAPLHSRTKSRSHTAKDLAVDVQAANATALSFIGRPRPAWMIATTQGAQPAFSSTADASSSPEPERIASHSPVSTVSQQPTSSSAYISLDESAAALNHQGATAPTEKSVALAEHAVDSTTTATGRLSGDTSPLTAINSQSVSAQRRQATNSPIVVGLTRVDTQGAQQAPLPRHPPPPLPSTIQPNVQQSNLASASPSQTQQFPLKSLLDLYGTYKAFKPRLTPTELHQIKFIESACKHNDYFFLAFHQAGCVRRLQPPPPRAGHQAHQTGLNLLEQVAIPAQGVSNEFLYIWANFPRDPSVEPADSYTKTYTDFYHFAGEFATTYPSLLDKCRAADRPPLFIELCPLINSVLFKRAAFRQIVNVVWPDLSPAVFSALSAIFDEDVGLHRKGTYNDSAARTILSKYRGAAMTIRQTRLEAFSLPHQMPYFPVSAQSSPLSLLAIPSPHASSTRSGNNSLVPYFQRSLLPGVHADLDQPAVPDQLMYGLHQSNLIDPPLRLVNYAENPVPTFQYVADFLLPPAALDQLAYFTESTFSLPHDMASNRVQQTPPEGPGTLPVLQAAVGSFRFRLQCKRANGLEDISSRWTSLKTHWPGFTTLKCNDARLQLRRKAQFGLCLPADITHYLREGNNTIAVSNLAAAARAKATKKPGKYAYAIEIVKITSACEIELSVLSSVKPASECLEAITGTNSAVQDDDVMSIRTTISLKDPIMGGAIWKIPVRGKGCKHRDAFDLGAFLESRRLGKPDDEPSSVDAWRCPICLGDARPCMLVADGWLMGVRDELERRGRLDAVRIEVDESGNWEIVEESTRQQQPAVQTQATDNKKISVVASEVIVLD